MLPRKETDQAEDFALEFEKPDIEYTNQFILDELTNMLLEMEEHFHRENHGIIWRAFEYLYISDRDLREQIAKILSPLTDDHLKILPSEKDISELIELQGFFNAIRLQLLQRITQHIINYYENALTTIKTDLKTGTDYYQLARRLDEWYLTQLMGLKPDNYDPVKATAADVQEDYSTKLWVETIEVFQSVRDSAEIALKRILSNAIEAVKTSMRVSKGKPVFNFD